MSKLTTDFRSLTRDQAETSPREDGATTAPAGVRGMDGALHAPSHFDLYRESNLTANQLQVWIAQTLVPEVPVYHLTGALRIHGDLDPNHFRKAFQVLINSSDALRTVVEKRNGVPMQRVLPELKYALDLTDLSHLADKQQQVQSWMEERCRIPMNWGERLFDSVLIRLSRGEFIWYLNAHHLICDGWSFGLIYRHMADLYRQSLRGRLPRTIALLPFDDYIVHEREHRDSPRYRKAEEYWNKKLAEADGRISFYGKVPLTPTTRVRRLSHDLAPELTKKLASLTNSDSSRTEGNSLSSVFTAVMAAYLRSIDGKESYSIGVAFHNRRSKAFKETLGFFSEVLPVRVGVGEDDSLVSLLRKVREETFQAARHGQHSIANPHFKKVYEVSMNYHAYSFSDFAGMAASPGWIATGHGDDSFALQVHDFGGSGKVVLDFEFHEAIFNEREAGEAMRHFLRLLEAFAADPEQRLRRIALLSPEEARQMVTEWSAGVVKPPARRRVDEIVAEQAAIRPNEIAVVSPPAGSERGEEKRLTYQELNRRANQLARCLRRRGVRPETLVGLYLERSLEMIVGILGILKAGAAYVPLDPKYPGDWLKFALEDTRAPILLTQGSLLGTLPEDRPEVICLDAADEAIERESGENVPSGATWDHPAYVIYTSGTTGHPRGVEIAHRALANFAAAAAGTFDLKPADRVLQFASVSFDTAVEEIFPCLMSGATLVLRTDSMLESTAAFVDKCRGWGVTVLDLPTAYWHEITAALYSERLTLPDQIRLVVIGGERAVPERLSLWRECVSDRIRLLNTYGPTETSVTATVCDLTDCGKDGASFEEAPIGRPIANVQTYVLDACLRPVPAGVPGELYIGGMGLARGYLNLPGLSAEKFIPNPFSPVLSPTLPSSRDQAEGRLRPEGSQAEGNGPGSRLYKTGDLVRYRRDGNLEFLRRIDSQVKVRGFRVELEGIEAALRKHPLVREAVVVQDRSSTLKPLIACLVPKENAVLNIDDLRAFMAKRLPDYMIPAVFVMLDSLPLTVSGKVDRRALSLQAGARSDASKIYLAPRTPAEKQLARIWSEVLHVERVGRDDHFFELGGHSLLAIQVVSRIRRELKVGIPLRAIFEAPTLDGLSRRVEEAKSQGQYCDDAIPTSLESSEPSSSGVPLSFSQTRMWFMEQIAPESAAYNIPAPIRLTGTLDKEALKRSLNELVRRHESLRTTFRNTGEGLVQVVTQAMPLEIPEIDLRGIAETSRTEEAKRLLREQAGRPFDLERGPLFQVLLLQLADEDHVILLNMHHAISDQWSLGVIARELASFYNAFRSGLPAPAHPAAARYADFALAQGRYLTRERLETELSYWKKQLSGLRPLELPTDRPRPPVQTFHGTHDQFSLSKEMVEGLKKLGVEENATLFMVFLGVFKALLLRYTGQEDIALGSPIANRNRSEWEGIVGTFVNVLVLRTDLSGNPTFREVLRRVREVVLEAFAHQEMPFEKLVEQLQPARDASRSPLVQLLFNFHNPPSGKMNMAGLSWAPFEIDTAASQFDISVAIDPDITRKIWLAYNTDLYDAATIGRLLTYFGRFLEAAARNPDQPIGKVLILTDAERRQLLLDSNDTRQRYPRSCIHELFEAQARRTPDSVAVIFPSTGSGPGEDQQLSYRDLDRRADRVADALRGMGVGPEVRVGICMERSPELIIGLLAILKAGGAYVPIDPAYPFERITFMVKDSGMRLLLTQDTLMEDLRQVAPRVVSLERLERRKKRQRQKKRARSVKPNHLSYVIYTSGSTGNPKGVQIEHRALVNFLHAMRQKIGVDDRDMLMGVTTVSFDIAALEIFLPLIVGGRVVMASRETASDGMRLRELLESSGATVMQATPATWRLLLEAGWRGTPGFKILCGGELLSGDLAASLRKEGSVVWNLYGPTETTVWSTAWGVDPSCDRVSIGRPIANTQVYLLDANLEPVLPGVAGEMHIGGDGVARGYLNRPELTAEKFISNPFSDKPGDRLYKTGDLARYLPDGNIEILGRIDHQVKIRGFRVELGEIEAVLSQHPAVRETVVHAQEDAMQAKRLVGYVVPDPDSAPSTTELRSFLREKLPDYMVPSAFVFLDKLPLTPNGKVDRKALPEPELTRPDLEQGYVHPRTPVEEILAGIWAEVLRLVQVGVHDNFFELGGHSLLATQVLSRLRDALQVDIPLRFIFEAPTVAGLAGRVEAARRVAQGPPPAPIVRMSRNIDLPLSFAQQRLWFLNQLDPISPAYNITGAACFTGPLQVTALERSLTEILRRHEALRTTFRSIDDGLPVQIITSAEPLSLPVADLTDLSEDEREEEARRIAIEEAKEPFDLERGPLIRAKLLRMNEARHVLVLVIHHIASDGWSHGVLFREVATLYEAFSAGKPSPLPELPIQYPDYAVWQQEWLQGEILEEQLSYWKRQLHRAPPVLELPTDRPRLPIRTFRGARQSLQLSPPLTEALKELSRREGVTLFMTLLAAFQTLLRRYGGQDDVPVGSPIANRTRAEIEGLIGFFANTLVLRTDLSGNPSFRELLGRVREVALGAYAHQDLPFEKLVEELRPERHLGHTPLFQVMFVLQNAPNTALELADLVISPLEVGSETSKFDLTLFMTEGSEGLKGVVEYSSDLFEAGTIRRMLDHFQTLLENIVADTDQKILEIPLLSQAESNQLLAHWKGPQTDYPKDGCVHQLFEERAARSPEKVALVCENRQLTYGELNQRANQLARYLRRLGVGPETLVAISVGRSLEMAVGILGILKAGGAWLPLDPAYPKERLAYMLRDSHAPFLLTEAQVAAALPEHSAKTVLLDKERPLISRQNKANPPDLSSPKDPAYVIYTSGSTGRPNGVMISHESLCHYAHAMGETLGMTTDEVYLHTATISFSSSVRQLMVPLAYGARVVIASLDRIQQPVALFEMIKDEGVTIIDIVPSYWRHCIYELESLEASARKALLENQLCLVLTASEPLWSDLPDKWAFGLRHPAKLINMFGQTETTGIVATYPVPRRDGQGVKIVPIGRPIASTEIYVLDHQRRPVPVGVTGEIYVGGAGLARGYLNQSELTAERFVPNPFSNDPGARLYRTGDLGRYSHEGHIEFAGRTDRQVKIRGFRIELGEIETALGQHPVVREAAVVVYKVASGNPSAPLSKDNQLAAYVVFDQGLSASTTDLRGFLKEKLPDYMVPSAFVFLDKLPLTPSGKVDRRALPEPEPTRPELEQAFIAPRTLIEEALAGIWSRLLGVERVGVHDNFFDLGGHSLLAIQVISRLRKTFGVEISLRALFEYPTIAGLAVRIAEAQAKDAGEDVAEVLSYLESLSDEEAERLLAQESSKEV